MSLLMRGATARIYWLIMVLRDVLYSASVVGTMGYGLHAYLPTYLRYLRIIDYVNEKIIQEELY